MSIDHKLALYVAYYLSRFNETAYQNLGFGTQRETHIRLGAILKTKPHTIKNMRDQFDPYHGHRAGWHQEPLSPSRAKVSEALHDLSENEVWLIVKRIINNRAELESEGLDNLLSLVNAETDKKSGTKWILRGVTGKQAEEFFIKKFQNDQLPVSGKLIDCRQDGVGYDFRIEGNLEDYFIEIKGIADFDGGVLFTNKEWSTAQEKSDRYYLGIVSNIRNTPEINFVQDPFKVLKAKMHILNVLQISWSVTASQLKSV